MNENRIYTSIKKVVPDDAAKHRMLHNILAKANTTETIKAIRRPVRRGTLVAAIAAAVFILGTVGAFATGAVSLNRLHSAFLGEGAENEGFNVDTVSVGEGIEIRLQSAVADEEYVYAFMSITDLESDRLDEKLAWRIIRGEKKSLFGLSIYSDGVTVLDYDEKEKTATIVMRLTAASRKGFSAGDKINFSINELSSGHENFQAEFDINLYELADRRSFSGTTEYSQEIISFSTPNNSTVGNMKPKQQELLPMLQKDGLSKAIDGIDWAVMSNIGYIDGKLHIQFKRTDSFDTYNMGAFSLHDSYGNRISEYYSVGFGKNDAGTNDEVYEELVYDITPEMLKTCSLTADCSSVKHTIKGNWRLELTVESVMKSRTLTASNLPGVISKITVTSSPVTTRLDLTPRAFNIDANTNALHEIIDAHNYLILSDGTEVPLKVYSGYMDHERIKGAVYLMSQYYNQGELLGISINGEVYFFE